MKVLVTGGTTGQLRWELTRTVPDGVDAVFMCRDQLDVTKPESVAAAIETQNPDVIINASAYTNVDKAETDKDAAFSVNHLGVKNLAVAAKEYNARMIHVSTDFVFDGQSSTPYTVGTTTCPLGVYGESKLAGEVDLQTILAEQGLIIRTAWVYSSFGNNFVKTMLRLMSERPEIGVIADQSGTPTWARGLADAIWLSAKMKLVGIHHWTDAGITSWYDFAQAIYEEGQMAGILQNNVRIKPLTTSQYPTPAKRPPYSVLDKSITWEALDLTADHWRVSLRKMLQEL